MRKIAKVGLIILFSFVLISCSSLFGPSKSTTKTFIIDAMICPPTKSHSQRILLVTQSEASPIYNTTMMAYSKCAFEVEYFAKNSWVATPPQMLEPLIVATMQDTHHFRAVLTSPSVANYDYILNTQLVELQQQFCRCSSFVSLVLRAQLINAATNKVIAVKQFCIVEPAAKKNPYCGVIATNRATARLLDELARFVLQKI